MRALSVLKGYRILTSSVNDDDVILSDGELVQALLVVLNFPFTTHTPLPRDLRRPMARMFFKADARNIALSSLTGSENSNVPVN